MLEFLANYKDFLQLVLVAIPGFILTVFFNKWQKFGKQLDLINSVRAAFSGGSEVEQNMAFTLLISLPNTGIIRQAIGSLPFQTQVKLVKSSLVSAVRSSNISALRRIVYLFPDYRNLINDWGPLYSESGYEYYGELSQLALPLTGETQRHHYDILFFLIKSGHPLFYTGWPLPPMLDDSPDRRNKLPDLFKRIVLTNDKNVVIKVLEYDKIARKEKSWHIENFSYYIRMSLAYKCFESAGILIRFAAQEENYSQDALQAVVDFNFKEKFNIDESRQIINMVVNCGLSAHSLKLEEGSQHRFKELLNSYVS